MPPYALADSGRKLIKGEPSSSLFASVFLISRHRRQKRQRSPPIYRQESPPGGPCLEGAFMTRKFACTLAILGTLTVSAQAQQSVPKPTKADAVKLVQIISANKAKIATYCKLADLGDEINNASSAGDKSKAAQLSKEGDGLGKALGPEFVRLTAGLQPVNFQSKEGQELSAELEKLDN